MVMIIVVLSSVLVGVIFSIYAAILDVDMAYALPTKEEWKEMSMDSDAEVCYECQGYGDDYYLDGNNEWVCACDDCYLNSTNWEED